MRCDSDSTVSPGCAVITLIRNGRAAWISWSVRRRNEATVSRALCSLSVVFCFAAKMKRQTSLVFIRGQISAIMPRVTVVFMEAVLSGDAPRSQSASVNITGVVGTVYGDIVGANKTTTTTTQISTVSLVNPTLRPIADMVEQAPAEVKPDAQKKLATLDEEVAKGSKAQDSVVAGLLQDIVGLIPKAAGAVVSAFASPILGAIAGPATKYVIDRFRGS
jgi:hypothetical protein